MNWKPMKIKKSGQKLDRMLNEKMKRKYEENWREDMMKKNYNYMV